MDLAFEAINLWMIVWWAIWIIAPRSRAASWVGASWIPVIPPLGIYLALIVPGLADLGPILLRPQLTPIQTLLGSGPGAFAGWVHFLIMDFLVGRWILQQGVRDTIHPWLLRFLLFLTLMLGPVGGCLGLWILERRRTSNRSTGSNS